VRHVGHLPRIRDKSVLIKPQPEKIKEKTSMKKKKKKKTTTMLLLMIFHALHYSQQKN
jgi:hypothetical protein